MFVQQDDDQKKGAFLLSKMGTFGRDDLLMGRR
jgi:hypothetical protein